MRAAVLAASPLSECENVNTIREMIHARNWELVSQMKSGDWTSDWLQWLLVQRANAPAAIVEVYLAYDPFVDDSASLMYELSPAESDGVCEVVTSWEGP
jgi:hypothetical protein